MRRKRRVLACALALAHVHLSCVAHTRVQVPPTVLTPGEKVTIVGAVTTSGERLEYPARAPAVVRNGDLCATEALRVELRTVPRAEVKKLSKLDGDSRPDRIVTVDGQTFEVSRFLGADDKEVRFETRVPVPPPVIEILKADVASRSWSEHHSVLGLTTKDGRVYRDVQVVGEDESALRVRVRGEATCKPLAEYQQLVLRKVDSGKTALYTIGGLLLTWGVGFAIAMATKESCPFVYSFDGKQYVFDAEPYGGAICPALKRTEWCRLEHLREVDGRYRLRLTNEVDETQHTDELKLLVADHPRGTRVVPDGAGGLHAVSAPLLPLSARDRRGRDLLPYVAAGDAFYWESQLAGGEEAWDGALREELTFEFPKPAGTREARLLFDGCNTLWASQMLKRYLALHGREVSLWYERLRLSALERAMIATWSLREETYALRIRVETARGWVTRGTIVGGGPFLSEERVYPIDVSDVAGERLRVRLLPPAGFWMVNSLAVDYGRGVPARIRELAPLEARDHAGADLREALAATDDRYVSMPQTGQWADIAFAAPPREPGTLRSFVVKASGYYDIHLSPGGEPRREILARYESEPGFSVRFALEEYRRWIEEVQAGRSQP